MGIICSFNEKVKKGELIRLKNFEITPEREVYYNVKKGTILVVPKASFFDFNGWFYYMTGCRKGVIEMPLELYLIELEVFANFFPEDKEKAKEFKVFSQALRQQRV